jgi:predicted Zn-dependent protease
MKSFIIFILIFSTLAHADFRKRIYEKEYPLDASDIKLELDFGKSLAARLVGKFPLVDDPPMQDYVNRLGASLVAQIGRPEIKYYFGVIKSEEINAYACPGGYIFITLGTMRKLKNEAQLVGVLAHEIAHVNHRHVINELGLRGKDGGLASAASAMIGGSSAPFRLIMESMLDKASEILFSEGLTQSDEDESDKYAIETIVTFGYDHREYYHFFHSLLADQKTRTVRKTHPPLRLRLSKMKEELKNLRVNSQVKVNVKRFMYYVQL